MNLFSCIDFSLCILSAYVGVYHSILYIKNRADNEKLHFSLLCFAISINDGASAGLYNATSVSSGILCQNIQFFCAAIISIEFINFTYKLINKKSDYIKKILITLVSLVLFCGIFLNNYVLDLHLPMQRVMTIFGTSVAFYEHKPSVIWNSLYIIQIIGMCYLYALLLIEFFKNKKRDLFPLILGFLIFFVSVIIDILISINKIVFLYTVEYSFLIMILVMDYILLKRFIGVFNEVEELNLHLGEKVKERTLEIKMMADELLEANKELEAKNLVLTELAERDSMTSLLNHAAFHSHLRGLLNMSRRQKFPICVMILDIDNFKKINDIYGHQFGDKVLKTIGSTIDINSRNYDIKSRYKDDQPELRNYHIAGRYGGDEFAIALPYCGVKETQIISERICMNIRGLIFDDIPQLHVTSSIGCAVLLDHSVCENELQLIKIADQALYSAKEKGRDKAVIMELNNI